MRYSRYYSKRNFDGSRSVLRMGPLTTAGMKINRSVFGTIFVFMLADALIFGHWIGVATAMLWPMIILAIICHYKFVKPRLIREGKLPPRNKSS